MYKNFLKGVLDFILSFFGIIILAVPMLIIAITIKIQDPGPVFFKQQRVGKGKRLFWLYKFRSMKQSTPKDVPTHLLENPEQYITKIGAFLRKTSLDELPQIFNLLSGKMSIVGPRPALWNQDDLISEREQYGANDVRPGLTGWAQINGRDELEISLKARLDGEYVERLGSGSLNGFIMDLRCFFGTIKSVVKSEGIVEGGTGEIERRKQEKDSVNNQ